MTAPDDETRLAPREQAAIDEAVVRLEPRGNGPVLVAGLVALAFVLGLVRPWDLLTARPGPDPGGPFSRETPAAVRPGPVVDPGASPTWPAAGGDSPGGGSPRLPPDGRDPTCGYPGAWRMAAVQQWAGSRARVWTAAEAVRATGPGDPAIPFHVIASDTVEAIGWCAPVRGDERPPLAAVGSLFRLLDGRALEVAVDRLEPAVPDALGELWLPRSEGAGRRAPWPAGRYVIRLATTSGSYERYLGIEIGMPVRAAPSPRGAPSSAPSPSASGVVFDRAP